MISRLIPASYFMGMARGIFLKGLGFRFYIADFAALMAFSTTVYGIAIMASERGYADAAAHERSHSEEVFLQILRDRALICILIWAFTAAIYTSGHGRAMEITNVPTAVYDLSHSPASREFLSHLQLPYLKTVAYLEREQI